KLPEPQGALVQFVEPDGPAARAGLRPGDVIVKLEGKPVVDGTSFRNQVASLPAGAKASFAYFRDGRPENLELTIGDFPTLLAMGMRLRDLTGEQAGRLLGDPRPTVIIEDVLPRSEAERAGLRPGLRLVGVGDRAVSSKLESYAAAQPLDPVAGIPLRLMAP